MSTTSTPATMVLGYARVSTLDQNEDLQLDALSAAGCDQVFTDHASGRLASRPALDDLLSRVRPGDTLVVWKLDRLGRSLKHLLEVVAHLEERGGGPEGVDGADRHLHARWQARLSCVRGVGGVRAGPDPGTHQGGVGCCACPWTCRGADRRC